MKRVIAPLLIAAALASCTTTSDDAQANIQKTYDVTCAAEPAIYASYVAIRAGKGKTPATGVVDAHAVVVGLCTNRPTDIVSAAITLASAYAQIIAAK